LLLKEALYSLWWWRYSRFGKYGIKTHPADAVDIMLTQTQALEALMFYKRRNENVGFLYTAVHITGAYDTEHT
jgi:hypothetical protein